MAAHTAFAAGHPIYKQALRRMEQSANILTPYGQL